MAQKAKGTGEREQTRQSGAGRRSLPEMITLVVSVAIVLAVIGVIVYQLLQPTEPLRVEVRTEVDKVYEANGAYYLPVEVKNSGGQSGEDVTVKVTLRPPGGEPEEAELHFPFLGPESTARGVAVFGEDPRQHEVGAKVTSYIEP